MKYKISDVAKLLDITPEAIRYYESKGIIAPERSEATGYRYYGGWEIHMLIRARIYRQLGYTLDETAKLLNNYENDDIISNLSDRKEDIKKEIVWKSNILKHIEKEEQSMIASNELIGKYRIEYRPDIYRLEMQNGYVLHPDKYIQKIIFDWLNKIPFVFTSTLFSLVEVESSGKNFSVGLGVYKEYAELLDIEESDYVKLYPSRLCIQTGIQSKSNRTITPELLAPAIEYMNSQGMELSGDVLTKSALMRKVGDDYINWHQAWLPFNQSE
ncbi:hypothetical protein CIW83_08990 [Tissierella sp. P1]|uniref:MerR family transcriptional regulator n=1 Tax=Tissierella TaxID=41273 RepID=UPI000BA0BAB0|nr:MerR family transcriptional regulator [Tissierella sp. P1]OZV12503.1 hypothetical protein CIW83_08990 [Tissierella sp. P1]